MVDGDVAMVEVSDALANIIVGTWQSVKGDRGVEVMLGVIGHVPHEKAYWPGGQRGTRVSETLASSLQWVCSAMVIERSKGWPRSNGNSQ